MYKGKEIDSLIPHRKPFKFVDEIISANEEKIVAQRVFTKKEPFFKGHFPKYPVVPGVILVESLAQAGGAGLSAQKILPENSLFFLATVDKVKFRRQVRPGDTVRLEVTNLRISQKMIKQSGIAYIDDDIVAEAEWMCLVSNAEESKK
ncbi:MAG: 3-hydroxyacyl-ACP dehydratase FabZ [Treponemataceae bacterium]